MAFTLPTFDVDPFFVSTMGQEYAEDARNRDCRIAVRAIFDRASAALAKSRKELEILERADSAFTVRHTYYANCAKLHAKIAREMEKISAIYEAYPTESLYW